MATTTASPRLFLARAPRLHRHPTTRGFATVAAATATGPASPLPKGGTQLPRVRVRAADATARSRGFGAGGGGAEGTTDGNPLDNHVPVDRFYDGLRQVRP